MMGWISGRTYVFFTSPFPYRSNTTLRYYNTTHYTCFILKSTYPTIRRMFRLGRPAFSYLLGRLRLAIRWVMYSNRSRSCGCIRARAWHSLAK